MNNFLIEHLPTIMQIMVVVAGMAFLFVAWNLCNMENWGAGVVTGLLGAGLLALGPIDHFSEKARLADLAIACSQAPTKVDDRLHHRYTGTITEPPGPLGAVGSDGPHAEAVFLHVDHSTDTDSQGEFLALRLYPDTPQPDTRVDFCGHAAKPVYWWPREGHQGRRALYGQPEGPYPAVRWVRNMDG